MVASLFNIIFLLKIIIFVFFDGVGHKKINPNSLNYGLIFRKVRVILTKKSVSHFGYFMKSFFVIFMLIFAVTGLTGCVHKIVTVPVKVAYKTTKGVVKGTTAVVKAVVPGDGDDDDKKDKD